MKTKSLLSLLCALVLTLGLGLLFGMDMSSAAAEAEVPLDEAHFPDPNFRQYIGTLLDNDGDGFVNRDDMFYEDTISCPDLSITSLVGIEYFETLESLDCSGNQLTTLDLSQNANLNYLSCENNSISDLYIVSDYLSYAIKEGYVTDCGDYLSFSFYEPDGINNGDCLIDKSVRVCLDGEWIDMKDIKEKKAVAMTPESATMAVGDTLTINCEVNASDWEVGFFWASSDDSIVTVEASYYGGEGNNWIFQVRAVSRGNATLTAWTEHGFSGECEITVTGAPEATEITLNKKGTVKLDLGKKLTLKATVLPKGAETKITWTSSDEDIATVSSKGVVKPKKAGTTTVTATTDNGLTASVKIKVFVPKVKKVTLNKKGIVTMQVGRKLRLKAKVTPSAADQTITWKSSNKKVAGVTYKGLVVAKKPGVATITARGANGKYAKVKIRVVDDDYNSNEEEITDEDSVMLILTDEDAEDAEQIGWQKTGNAWYYLDEEGEAMTGWLLLVDNETEIWYWLDEETGEMASEEWNEIEGVWYYFAGDGRMATGWQVIDGRREQFNENGAWVGSGE